MRASFAIFVLALLCNCLICESTICNQMQQNQIKIRAIGRIYNDSLAIVTTSGDMFQMNLEQTLMFNKPDKFYYLDLSSAQPTLAKDKWTSIPALNFTDSNDQVLYFIFNNQNAAYLGAIHKTNGKQSLCPMFFNFVVPSTDQLIAEHCSRNVNGGSLLNKTRVKFMISHSAHLASGFSSIGDDVNTRSLYITSEHENLYVVSDTRTDCQFSTIAKPGSGYPLSGFYHEESNLLFFINRDGSVEQFILDKNGLCSSSPLTVPDSIITAKQFIYCGSTTESTSLSDEKIEDITVAQALGIYWMVQLGIWVTDGPTRIICLSVFLFVYVVVCFAICLMITIKKNVPRKSSQ